MPGGYTAVFDYLIESQRETKKRKMLGVGTASLVIHTVVIAAVAYATLNAGQGDTAVKADTTVLFIDQPQQERPTEQRPMQLDLPPNVSQTAVALDEIRINLPTVDLQRPFDAHDYHLPSRDGGGGATDPVGTANDVFSEAIVEEKPSVLSGATPVYPELLKEAGIQGRVVVQAVIDTLGRAEGTSVKILQSPNPGFDPSARNYVLNARLRPARVHGRAVRVLINIPIDFRITPAH